MSSEDIDNIALSIFDSAQAIFDSDSDEEEGKGHGGSASGKRSNIERDFDEAMYFGVDGRPPPYSEVMFESRFRLPHRFVTN